MYRMKAYIMTYTEEMIMLVELGTATLNLRLLGLATIKVGWG
jgi:hypothetical protein